MIPKPEHLARIALCGLPFRLPGNPSSSPAIPSMTSLKSSARDTVPPMATHSSTHSSTPLPPPVTHAPHGSHGRYHKASKTQRPRAYEQCVVRRAVIDAYDTRHPLNLQGKETTPFYVGDTILCRGQPGTISSFAFYDASEVYDKW